jgi:hypothetical protein
VITDRELDAQLAAAAGLHDADLPALPEDFLAVVRADDVAREEPASIIAARQLVTDAHDARTVGPLRRRRPGRRALLRTGAAVVGIAAVWAAAVLVAPSDPAGTPHDGTAAPTAAPASPSGPIEVDGMTLVATERVTFPFSLEPEPEGLSSSFGRAGGPTPFGTYPVTWGAEYRAEDGAGFTFSTSHEDPRVEWEFEHMLPQWDYANADVVARGSTVVDGAEADFVTGEHDRPSCRSQPATPLQTEEPGEVCTSTFTDLIWERPDGRWMWLRGDDEYADTSALVAVAESIVDRPRPVDLQVGLAPAGWEVTGYENGSMALVSADDPDQRLGVSLMYRWRRETVQNAFQGMYSGPERWVAVNDRPAKLVLVDQGDFDEWFLAGELDGGVLFMIQTPSSFTEDQVVEIAEQVTYTP